MLLARRVLIAGTPRASTLVRTFFTEGIKGRSTGLQHSNLVSNKDLSQYVNLLRQEGAPVDTNKTFGRILVSTDKDKPELSMVFANRDKEVETLARVAVGNYGRWKMKQPNTHKLETVITAQMHGSGKTALGEEWKRVFFTEERFRELRESLRQSYPEAMKHIESAHYIQIDLREMDLKLDLNSSIKMLLWKRLMIFHAADLDGRKDFLSLWTTVLVHTADIKEVVKAFQAEFKVACYIFHFDECDKIGDLQPRLLPVLENALRTAVRFNMLWEAIHPVLTVGSILWASGRSPYLYTLGRGFFKPFLDSGNKVSECLLLDLLSADHLRPSVNRYFPDLAEKDQEILNALIHKRTAGVPRIAQLALEYLSNWKKDHLKSSQEAFLEAPAIFGAKGPFLAARKETHQQEFDPIGQLVRPCDQVFYMYLVRCAALNIPVDINRPVSSAVFGLLPEVQIPVAEVLRLFNIYFERQKSIDNKGYAFIRFPPLVLDCLLQNYSHFPDLELWSCLNQIQHNKGSSFEVVITNAIAIHFGYKILRGAFIDNIAQTLEVSDLSIEDMLPFFKGSYVQTFPRTNTSAVISHDFPKVSRKVKSTFGDKPAFQAKAKKIQDFMDGTSGTAPVVHPLDFIPLLRAGFIKPDHLYFPAPQSRFGDLFMLHRDTWIVVQSKHGKQFITTALLETEVNKLVCMLYSDQNMTVIFASIMGLKTLSGFQPVEHNGVVYAHRLASCESLYRDEELTELTKPEGLSREDRMKRLQQIEAVVLTEAGMKRLLSEPIFDMYSKGTQVDLSVILNTTAIGKFPNEHGTWDGFAKTA